MSAPIDLDPQPQTQPQLPENKRKRKSPESTYMTQLNDSKVYICVAELNRLISAHNAKLPRVWPLLRDELLSAAKQYDKLVEVIQLYDAWKNPKGNTCVPMVLTCTNENFVFVRYQDTVAIGLTRNPIPLQWFDMDFGVCGFARKLDRMISAESMYQPDLFDLGEIEHSPAITEIRLVSIDPRLPLQVTNFQIHIVRI